MNWYVVGAKPKQEDRAEQNLQAWRIETLLPRVRCRRGRSVANAHTEPLFPGYLFARFDAGTMLGKLRYTRGVASILGTSSGPTSLDECVIQMIRTRMSADGVVQMPTSLNPGDRVRITAGPFKDFVGVFEYSSTAADRVSLLLETVAAQIRVTVEPHVVRHLQ